jgi:hypothetical protein
LKPQDAAGLPMVAQRRLSEFACVVGPIAAIDFAAIAIAMARRVGMSLINH